MLNRRQILNGSISGFFAFAARNNLSNLFTRVSESQSKSRFAKRCIVLWMEGGPSQLDTFDPKPGAATGGPFKSIKTSSPDIEISENLPLLARQMDNLSVIRNLTSNEGEHIRARYYLHTGFEFAPSFPRPSLGSVVSHELPESDIPRYVSLGSAGFGPAFMGPANAPFSVENHQQAVQLIKNIRRRSGRIKLLSELDRSFNQSHNDPRVQQRRANLEKIERLASTRFADALNVERFSNSDRVRYGDSEFGRRCLIAKQLLDLGTNFVEVQLGGWDTHANNFASVKRLCETLDQPFAALVQDLKSSGMYDDTILIWMGEFGRTPNINGTNGRDHFPACTPVVIGGGPLRNGQVVGKTSPSGQKIDGSSYKVADLFATIFSRFGIEPDREFTTDFDSPTTATDQGRIISELV